MRRTAGGAALGELEADYVDTFDNRRRHNLFLTYFAHGDTRKRGMALLRFKQTYLASGFELTDDRAARPPVRRPGVRRHHRPRARPRADPRPPRRPGAAADLARRGRLALGRCGRGGHRHAAAAAGRRAGRGPSARRRRTARGGGRPHAVRDARLRPGPRRAGRTHAAADAVVPREPADGRLPLGDRSLPVPGHVRGRPLLALPLRQVRLDHALLPALRGPDAADRQPAVPLRDARRRRRPRDRPAHPGVVDRRGRGEHGDLPRRRRRGRAGRGRRWPWSGWPS